MASDDLGTDCASTFGPIGIRMDRYFRRITGPLAVAHAVARRLTTPRGSLPWAPNVGDDLRTWMNEAMDRSALLGMANAARAEAESDERVESADVVVAFTASTSTATVTIDGQTGEGPFQLVLAVTAVSISVLSIQ